MRTKSIPQITIWHHEACLGMKNSDFEEQIFMQGSHRNSKTQFHDFSMIFQAQQNNFHGYLKHRLQPPLFAATLPC